MYTIVPILSSGGFSQKFLIIYEVISYPFPEDGAQGDMGGV
jgi:hypothetical protein